MLQNFKVLSPISVGSLCTELLLNLPPRAFWAPWKSRVVRRALSLDHSEISATVTTPDTNTSYGSSQSSLRQNVKVLY